MNQPRSLSLSSYKRRIVFMKRLKQAIPCVLFFFVFGNLGSVAKAFNPETDTLTYHTVPNINRLIEESDLIVYGELEPVSRTYSTSKRLPHGKLVNTVQSFQVKQTFKGIASTADILITGVEPLPRPRDPLNQKYPGALSTGLYIFFLHKINDTHYYQLTCGWQSVYPIFQGKSIAPEDTGFKALNHLTVDEFFTELKRYM